MMSVKGEVNYWSDKGDKRIIDCPTCTSKNRLRSYHYGDMHIYKCRDCDMMFQDSSSPLLLQNKFADDKNIKSNIFSNIDLSIAIANKTIERIRSLVGKKDFLQRRVLEVGTGNSALASLFVQRGIFYKGVEPSSFLYKQAIRTFPELKGKIENSLLQDANLPKNYFNLAVMTDTLEHIPDPVKFLKLLRTYLSDDGIIYIEVPNESWLKYKGYFRRLLGLYSGYPTHPGHVSLFTKKTLKKTLSLAGVDTLKLGQLSILGDYQRMKIVSGGRMLTLIKLICFFFTVTKLDLVFQQGNIVVVSGKRRL